MFKNEFLSNINQSWMNHFPCLIETLSNNYIEFLQSNKEWIPGSSCLFNVFSMPIKNIKYIIVGESPYPRSISANGYAFWDNNIDSIWSEKGLSKELNKATSLRNFVKMLLISEKLLDLKTISQNDIAKLDKTRLISTCNELFFNLINSGFFLFNACLVFSNRKVNIEFKYWKNFFYKVLNIIIDYNPSVTILLFGKVAQSFLVEYENRIQCISCEHPLNHSFVTNKKSIEFFSKFNLMRK